jgi:membrane-bound inhibitor of C-type lysozyme
MNRRRANIVIGGVLSVAAGAMGPSPASAQTFQNYHCADGTPFIVGFFKYDSRAYLQIDGGAVTLARGLALSGSRYSGRGITLRITRSGVTLKHAHRPTTMCELS